MRKRTVIKKLLHFCNHLKNKYLVSETNKIVLFDGICNLCNRTVEFIIRNDPDASFKFAPLQSEKGRDLLKQCGCPQNQIDFIVYIREGKCYNKSTAALLIFKDLGGVWKFFYPLIIIPPFIRDFLYSCIAKRRYQIFGKMESCMVPSPAIRERFLD